MALIQPDQDLILDAIELVERSIALHEAVAEMLVANLEESECGRPGELIDHKMLG